MHPDPASWYVLIGDQETGPLTRVELGVELATGAIATGSLVWKDGMTDWLPGVNVPELASLFRNPPRSPRSAGARPAPGREKGSGLNEFDTARFRLADPQSENGDQSRRLEFDAAHFRLQDLNGSPGARALVPKRIVPRGMEPKVAVEQPPHSLFEEELIPEAAIVDEPDVAGTHLAALSSWAVSEMRASAKLDTPPALPKKKSLPPPPVPLVRPRPPEQSWASLAIPISGALVLASSLLWYAISFS